jgi:hypothetical protein
MSGRKARTRKGEHMKIRLRLAVLGMTTVTAVLGTLVATPASPAAAAAGSVCYTSHIQDIGWQGTRCNGEISGTFGQGKRIESIYMSVSGAGTYCARVHVQDGGWQAWECTADGYPVLLATAGSRKRIEALVVYVSTGVCGEAHVQDRGWMGQQCGSTITLGTAGQSKRLEAFWLAV